MPTLPPGNWFALRSLLGAGPARDELAAFRDARLRHLLRHAWERVPYYRRLFDEHRLRPEDVRPMALATILLDTAPWLGEYRVVQEQRERVIVHMVPLRAPGAEDLDRLRAGLADLLGPGVHLELALATELPLGASGKARIFRSCVSSPYDGSTGTAA